MDFETIKLVRKDHLATITLNRPDKRNAINRKMMEELIAALSDISEDDNIRALILTGAGKAF
ncbi:MAG TPA: enoyl-CoA hydratase, partial [Desulfobacteraceae bacterium]|nr:enoyl-CoA hydratase [Desulfobacteraceae bacterium]